MECLHGFVVTLKTVHHYDGTIVGFGGNLKSTICCNRSFGSAIAGNVIGVAVVFYYLSGKWKNQKLLV